MSEKYLQMSASFSFNKSFTSKKLTRQKQLFRCFCQISQQPFCTFKYVFKISHFFKLIILCYVSHFCQISLFCHMSQVCRIDNFFRYIHFVYKPFFRIIYFLSNQPLLQIVHFVKLLICPIGNFCQISHFVMLSILSNLSFFILVV